MPVYEVHRVYTQVKRAESGDPEKAVNRLIEETGDGHVSGDTYVTVRRPTIEIPEKVLS